MSLVAAASEVLLSTSVSMSDLVPDFSGIVYTERVGTIDIDAGDFMEWEAELEDFQEYENDLREECCAVPVDVMKPSLQTHGWEDFPGLLSKSAMEFGYAAALKWGAMAVIAFMDYMLELRFLGIFIDLTKPIENVLANLLKGYNLYPVMLGITGLICFVWYLRGKRSKSLIELLIAIVIANYALASVGGTTETDSTPVAPFSFTDFIVGENESGFIYQARDFAGYFLEDLRQEICESDEWSDVGRDDGSCGDGDYDDEEFDYASPGEIATQVFLLNPLELLQFREKLPDVCRHAWLITLSMIDHFGSGSNNLGFLLRAVLRDLLTTPVPGSEYTYGDFAAAGVGEHIKYDDEAWKVPGTCVAAANGTFTDEELQFWYFDNLGDELKAETGENADRYAYMADVDGVLTLAALVPVIIALFIFTLVLAASVLIASIGALYQCVKALVAIMMAILPGGPRKSLSVTLASMVSSILIVMFTLIFNGGMMMLLDLLFRRYGNVNSATSMTSVFDGSAQDSSNVVVNYLRVLGIYYLYAVILLLGGFLFWAGRKRVKDIRTPAAEFFNKLTSAGGSAAPNPWGGGALGFMNKAGNLAHQWADWKADWNTRRYEGLLRFFGMNRPRGGGGGGGVGGGGGGGGGAARPSTARARLAGVYGRGGRTTGLGALTGGRLGRTAALAVMTGGLSLAPGLARLGVAGARGLGRGLAAGARRSAMSAARGVRWAGNRMWARRTNNADRRARLNTLNGARRVAQMRRGLAARRAWFDTRTRGMALAARVTNGRLGTARRLQNRQGQRHQLALRQQQRIRNRQRANDAIHRGEIANMRPAERARHLAWDRDRLNDIGWRRLWRNR